MNNELVFFRKVYLTSFWKIQARIDIHRCLPCKLGTVIRVSGMFSGQRPLLPCTRSSLITYSSLGALFFSGYSVFFKMN